MGKTCPRNVVRAALRPESLLALGRAGTEAHIPNPQIRRGVSAHRAQGPVFYSPNPAVQHNSVHSFVLRHMPLPSHSDTFQHLPVYCNTYIPLYCNDSGNTHD